MAEIRFDPQSSQFVAYPSYNHQHDPPKHSLCTHHQSDHCGLCLVVLWPQQEMFLPDQQNYGAISEKGFRKQPGTFCTCFRFCSYSFHTTQGESKHRPGSTNSNIHKWISDHAYGIHIVTPVLCIFKAGANTNEGWVHEIVGSPTSILVTLIPNSTKVLVGLNNKH